MKRWCLTLLVLLMLVGVCNIALGQDEEKAPPEEMNWFMLILKGGGPVGWVIMAGSVVMIALSIDNFMKISRDKLVPPGIESQIAQFVQKRRLDQLVNLVRGTDSYMTRILLKGLAEIQGSYVSMKQAMEEAGEEETIRLNQRISWLALIGNLAPMMGLFGTVLGMLEAFKTLGTDPNVDAQALASDIHVALVTTFLGLFVAMPAIFFYNFFRNRVVLYSLEVGGFCEQFLRLLRRTYGSQLAAAAATAIPAKPGAPGQAKGQQPPNAPPAAPAAGQGGPTPPVSPDTGQPPMIEPLPPNNPDQNG